MANLNPKQAEHLKRVFDDLKKQGISQAKVAELINVTTVSISNWKAGRQGIDPSNAKAISKEFPQYSAEYLLGYTDYANKDEEKRADLKQNFLDAYQMIDCVNSLAMLNGVTKLEALHEHHSLDEDFDGDSYFVEVTRDGRTLRITEEQWETFQKEVCNYVGFRLDQIFERGCW